MQREDCRRGQSALGEVASCRHGADPELSPAWSLSRHALWAGHLTTPHPKPHILHPKLDLGSYED